MADSLELNRPLMAVAALLGAAGVALAARGNHAADSNLTIASDFLLFHAPALIAAGLLKQLRWVQIAGWILTAAVALFAADLVARDMLGSALFPFAAPLGGVGMIVGWLALAVGLLLPRR